MEPDTCNSCHSKVASLVPSTSMSTCPQSTASLKLKRGAMPKVLVSEAAALLPAAGLPARRSGCCCVAAAVWLQARLADAFTMRRSSPESRDSGSTLTHTEAVVAPSSAAASMLEAVSGK